MFRIFCFKLLLISFSLTAAIQPQIIKDESKRIFNESLTMYIESQGSKLSSFSYGLIEDLNKNIYLDKAHSFTLSTPNERPIIGNQIQQLKLYDKLGNLIHETYLNIKLRASIEMLIANKSLKQNQMISDDDLTVQVRPLPKGDIKIEDHVFSKKESVGKLIQRQITRGEVLKFYMIKDKPLIQRGDQISLLMNKDWGQVKVEGVALDDGFSGNEIAVRSLLSNKKKMRGKVLDEKTVSIY